MRLFNALFKSSFALVAATLLLLAVPQIASAQATRTWVSGTGDDANPCSRTAPCKTFAGAISKTAAAGEIDCLDSAGYGAVTITKSMLIDCAGVEGGITNPSTNAITINAAGGNVTLRHLNIDGVAMGLTAIRVLAAATVQIDDTQIKGQTGNGIEITPTANTHVTIIKTVVREGGQHGIWVAPTGAAVAKVTVANCTLTDNGLTGIRLNDNSTATVTDSVLTGNGSSGAAASSTTGPSGLSLDRVVSSGNHDGGVLAKGPSAVVWLANSLLTANSYGFFPASGGGLYISFGNNRVMGNTITDGTPNQTIPQL